MHVRPDQRPVVSANVPGFGANGVETRITNEWWSLAFMGSASARADRVGMAGCAEALSITRLEGNRWRKKAGAVSLWSYIRIISEINRLRGTPSFNGAYDGGHGWVQHFTRSGRRASGFVQVA